MDLFTQNGIPIYHQLKEIFAEKIENGEWPVGEKIPNELFLCKHYGVSRGPVRQALDLLVRKGQLKRKQGKGTIVLPPKVESGLNDFSSFTSLIQNQGMQHSNRLLGFSVVTAQGSVAHWLKLNNGDLCFQIRRLRLANDEPLVLETVYVPQVIAPNLTEKDISSSSLYEVLSSSYATTPQKAKQFFEPAIADEYEAKELDISKGDAVLLIQNTTFDDKDNPLVFSKAVLRGDKVRYLVELSTQFSIV